MSLTPQEIEALNNWARTEPPLRGTFPYTDDRPGLGDRLNSLGADLITVEETDGDPSFDTDTIKFNSDAFYLTSDSAGKPIVNLDPTAGLIDHGSLSGLADNDHPQYLLAVDAITDHGALTGLLDDDHPQYLLVNGSRAMTGDLDMDDHNIEDVGTVQAAQIQAFAFYGTIVTTGTVQGTPDLELIGSSVLLTGENSLQMVSNGLGGVTLASNGGDISVLSSDDVEFFGDVVDFNANKVNLNADTSVVGTLRVSDIVEAEHFYLNGGGELLPNSQLDHGLLLGLADDDHTQYLLVDGTRAMTGDLNMGGKDVLNAAAGNFRDRVRAEAFYLESGGELSALSSINTQLKHGVASITLSPSGTFSLQGSAVSAISTGALNFVSTGGTLTFQTVAGDVSLIPPASGKINLNGYVQATDQIRTTERVVAEAFYFQDGAEAIHFVSDGPTTLKSRETLIFNQSDFYLTQSSSGAPVVNLVNRQIQVISPEYAPFTTTSTSVVPVPGAKFAVEAGGYYHFRACWLAFTSDTSQGVGFGFTVPAGTNSYRVSQPTGTGAGGGAGHIIDGTFSASSFQTPGVNAIGTVANTPALFTAEGLLMPSASGDVNLQLRVEDGTVAWTVNSGCVFFVTRIY